MSSYTIEYFGLDTVERATAFYFAKHGITEKVRDELMIMERENGDSFFQMVADFVEKK